MGLVSVRENVCNKYKNVKKSCFLNLKKTKYVFLNTGAGHWKILSVIYQKYAVFDKKTTYNHYSFIPGIRLHVHSPKISFRGGGSGGPDVSLRSRAPLRTTPDLN